MIYRPKVVLYNDLFKYFNFSIIKDMEYYFKANPQKTSYEVNNRLQIRKNIRKIGYYNIHRK